MLKKIGFTALALTALALPAFAADSNVTEGATYKESVTSGAPVVGYRRIVATAAAQASGTLSYDLPKVNGRSIRGTITSKEDANGGEKLVRAVVSGSTVTISNNPSATAVGTISTSDVYKTWVLYQQ